MVVQRNQSQNQLLKRVPSNLFKTDKKTTKQSELQKIHQPQNYAQILVKKKEKNTESSW